MTGDLSSAATYLVGLPAAGSLTDTVISGPFVLAGLLALAAGFVSFASPCVVPLVPGYVSYLASLVGADSAGGAAAGVRAGGGSGAVLQQAAPRTGRVQWRAVGATALFVLGFSAVFIAESALVLGVYTSFIENQVLLTRIAGVVSILMGVILALPALQREWRPGMRLRSASPRAGQEASSASLATGDSAARRGRLWGAPVLGAAFGTGWLACTSPTLAGILALSTATEWNGTAARGLVLVTLYCAGLGIPFLLLAVGFGWAASAVSFLRRHARVIQLCGAVALIVIGLAMVTGLWADLLSPLRGAVLLL